MSTPELGTGFNNKGGRAPLLYLPHDGEIEHGIFSLSVSSKNRVVRVRFTGGQIVCVRR